MTDFKKAAWGVTLSSVIQTFGFVIALPTHIGDPTWSWHAQFHLVLSVFWLAGLNILILILTWGPLQEGKVWSFWAVLTGFLFAQAGYFVSMALVWAGHPPELWHNVALGTNMIIGVIGLWLFWRAIFGNRRAGVSG